jgi:hypothetical protein
MVEEELLYNVAKRFSRQERQGKARLLGTLDANWERAGRWEGAEL